MGGWESTEHHCPTKSSLLQVYTSLKVIEGEGEARMEGG